MVKTNLNENLHAFIQSSFTFYSRTLKHARSQKNPVNSTQMSSVRQRLLPFSVGNLVLSMFPTKVVLTGAQAPTTLTWRACRQNGRPSVRVGGAVTDGVRVLACGTTPRTSVPEQHWTRHASEGIMQLMATKHLSRLTVLFTEIACSYPGSWKGTPCAAVEQWPRLDTLLPGSHSCAEGVPSVHELY